MHARPGVRGPRAVALVACIAGCVLAGCRAPTIPDGSGIARGPIREPGVVSVYTFRPRGVLGSHAQGTGFFVGPLEVVTNWHVVESAGSGTVRLANGQDLTIEGVVASDANADLVVLRLEPPDEDNPVAIPRPLPLCGTTQKIGTPVRIIGSPRGNAQTVVEGKVGSQVVAFDILDQAILVTAPTDVGMSGSPALDDRGCVVGIISRGTNADGESFMVPVSRLTGLQRHGVEDLLLWSAAQRALHTRRGTVSFAQATVAFERGDYRTAIEQLEFARAHGLPRPVAATSWYVQGDAHMNLGQPGLAVTAYQQALRLAPRHAFAHAALGHALRLQRSTQASVQAYEQAARLMPAMASFHTGHGWALMQARSHAPAAAAFRRALLLDRDAADAWTGAAAAARAEGNTTEARALARHATTLRPDLVQAWLILARACMEDEAWAEAIEAWLPALELRPADAQARFEYGYTLLKMGEREQARMVAQDLIRVGSPLGPTLEAAAQG